MTWIKYCGICRPEDFAFAVELQVDAIGVICVPDTPRFVSPELLRELAQLPRGKSQLVLVLQNSSSEFVEKCIEIANPDVLQFHGSETAFYCASFAQPYIKATRDGQQITALLEHRQAKAVLIDIPELIKPIHSLGIDKPIIIAGQLTAHNVASIIRKHRPFGVDVSRGIELEPRIKDHLLMTQFANCVRGVSAP